MTGLQHPNFIYSLYQGSMLEQLRIWNLSIEYYVSCFVFSIAHGKFKLFFFLGVDTDWRFSQCLKWLKLENKCYWNIIRCEWGFMFHLSIPSIIFICMWSVYLSRISGANLNTNQLCHGLHPSMTWWRIWESKLFPSLKLGRRTKNKNWAQLILSFLKTL